MSNCRTKKTGRFVNCKRQRAAKRQCRDNGRFAVCGKSRQSRRRPYPLLTTRRPLSPMGELRAAPGWPGAGFAARLPRIEYERNIHELSDHGDAEHPVTIAESEIYAIQNALPYAVGEAKRRDCELRDLLGTYVTDVDRGRPYQGKLPTSGNDPKIRKLVKFYLQYMVEPTGDEWEDDYQRGHTKDWLEGLPSQVESNWDHVAELEAERLEWQKTVAKERGMPLSKAHTIEV